MTPRSLAASPLALLLCLSLAACGGGGEEDSPSPTAASKFSSTDDVAGAISAYGSAVAAFSGELDGSNSKALAKRATKAKTLQAKATTTENCDSGSISFTTDDSTLYADDGLSVASSCRYSFSNNSSSGTFTSNGKLADRCTDSAQTSSACNASTIRIADGAAGGTTLDLLGNGSNNGERFDFEIKLKGDLSERYTSDTEDLTLSATLSFNDKVAQFSGSAVFENLRSVYTTTATGATETLNGVVGAASNKSRCSPGKITVRTDSALIYDSNDDTIGGQITLTDSSGGTAQISYNSDGSATVTLSNGQTRTYSRAQIEAFCS
jgi:hypothetical protein